MRKLEFFTSIVLLLFSFFLCLEAYKISLGTVRRPGPGFAPFCMGAILFVLAACYSFKTFRLWRQTQELHLWQGLRWGKVILVFALLFTYALLLEKVGFIICTILLLMVAFAFVDRQRWYWIYIGSPAITFLFYVLFKVWMKIQLPAGLLRI